MVFAHDTELALACTVALANTDGDDGEQLPDVASLTAFLAEWGWTGRHERTEAELDSVRSLRARLRRLWELDEDALVAEVNAMLRDSSALPQLVRHDGYPYHLHATPTDAPLATRMAVEAAMAFVDVVRSGELSRLRSCASDTCDSVVIDLSKNRSKRYCDGGCGNRAAVTAYRARKAATT
ncbi:CGNR zinc finger domain-containing protein [Dactylosporangium sp. AC04546]|uniref:CGNR zinc finger domain-containing protein n=1 Tax=Dactylosporangium sp. AC04546 TaxID=2862460 RepID=UPI001EDFA690|nr:CGNR zinc finger domain-containing protein [Dactylosporangium sp. AC04546]WVK79967.1 CGNR zinc finger domain-containing protein [Dactylosporangium sp. AC04546]